MRHPLGTASSHAGHRTELMLAEIRLLLGHEAFRLEVEDEARAEPEELVRQMLVEWRKLNEVATSEDSRGHEALQIAGDYLLRAIAADLLEEQRKHLRLI